MTPDALTVEQVREGLSALGVRLDERDEQASCPVCDGLMALTVRSNGNGAAHVECSAGCKPAEIIGALRVGRRMLERTATHDPLELVRRGLGVPTTERIVKRGKLGDSYELRLADGQVIDLGNAATLLNQAGLRARLLPQLRTLPPRLKAPEWDALIVAIEQAAEEIDNVATDADETRSWLGAWLPRSSRSQIIDLNDTAAVFEELGSALPSFYDRDGRLYVHLADFSSWVNRVAGTRITIRALSARLAALDFDKARVAARQGAEVRERRYWVSPVRFKVPA